MGTERKILCEGKNVCWPVFKTEITVFFRDYCVLGAVQYSLLNFCNILISIFYFFCNSTFKNAQQWMCLKCISIKKNVVHNFQIFSEVTWLFIPATWFSLSRILNVWYYSWYLYYFYIIFMMRNTLAFRFHHELLAFLQPIV